MSDTTKWGRKLITVASSVALAVGPLVFTNSAAHAAAKPVAPAVKTAPAISGTAQVGSRLTKSAGVFTGTPAPAKTQQWYACTATAAKATTSIPKTGCTKIAGATSTTYTLKTAQLNKYIRVATTAKNSKGSVISFSKSTAKITAAPVAKVITAVSIRLADWNDTNSFYIHDGEGQSWFPANTGWRSKAFDAGSSTPVAIKYHVTDQDGVAVPAGFSVTLGMNYQYSNSNASISGQSTGVQFNLVGTTDASGNVTFNVVNTDAACDGEAAWTSASAGSVGHKVYSQGKPSATNNTITLLGSDWVEPHFVVPASATCVANYYNVISTGVDATNSNDRTGEGWFLGADWADGGFGHAFLSHAEPAGSTKTFSWTVKNSDDSLAAGVGICLETRAASAVNVDGTARVAGPITCTDSDPTYKVTDSNGLVSWDVTSTIDAGAGEPAWSSPTSTDSAGGVFTQLHPVVAGETPGHTDWIEVHWTTAHAGPAYYVAVSNNLDGATNRGAAEGYWMFGQSWGDNSHLHGWFWNIYAAGSTQTISWTVTDPDGAAVSGVGFCLEERPESHLVAKIDGNTPVKSNATVCTSSEATYKTTNSSGVVSWDVTDTSSSGVAAESTNTIFHVVQVDNLQRSDWFEVRWGSAS